MLSLLAVCPGRVAGSLTEMNVQLSFPFLEVLNLPPLDDRLGLLLAGKLPGVKEEVLTGLSSGKIPMNRTGKRYGVG